MASEIADEPMARSDPSRPIEGEQRRPKPCAGGGGRVLIVFLRLAVMAAALSAFILLAGAAVLALVHLAVASRALRSRGPRRPAASALDVGALPSFRRPAAAAAEDCAVCLEALRAGQRCRALPACGHVFHSRCVDTWLVRSPACPICRHVVSAPAK